MNIYKITLDIDLGYDSYDSAIVCARDEEEARGIHPSEDQGDWTSDYNMGTWVSDPKKVNVEYIGKCEIYDFPGVILASFNAG